MLISYPILSAHIGAAVDEDDRFQRILSHELMFEGTYPVSHDGRWHGGVHLDTRGEPIRAIADATVACFRVSAQTETYPSQGPYDTGFVLLKHETETGESTKVGFYSLYMHLQPLTGLTLAQAASVPSFLREATTGTVIRGDTLPAAQRRVWRKDVLGYGGRLYSGRNRCHFEIFATDEQLSAFWRDSDLIAPGSRGHADWYGDTYYKLPAGRPFVSRPGVVRTDAQRAYYPELQAGSNARQLLIRARLHRGDQYMTVWEKQDDGAWALLSAESGQRIAEFEYNLCQRATALYPSCPSAGFELLRAGRVDGPSAGNLDQNARHNWQALHFAQGQRGYIDLNLPEHRATVLSDADFPSELGWRKVEEGRAVNANDGIADAELVRGVLALADVNQDGNTSSEEVGAYLTSRAGQALRTTMRRWVVKHPSEWDSRTLEQRYQRERSKGGTLHDESAWQGFREHAEKLCFQDAGGFNPVPLWHLHPLQFIRHFRGCGWLSAEEFARCIPRNSRSGTVGWASALSRAGTHSGSYNKFIRKYCGTSRERLAHNLAQTFIETGLFGLVSEDGAGRGKTYGAFYGRGYHQITWAGNYKNYGNFKGIPNHHGAYSDARITPTSVHAVDSGAD
jgi:hypothetical protein